MSTRLPWSRTVMATDACEDGYGVVSGEFLPSVVSVWGRRLERHRFRFMLTVHGRKHTLAELGPFSAAETVEDLSGGCEGRHVVDGCTGRDACHCWTVCHVCWRSAGPARGASDFCFLSDVPVPLGLPAAAGSIFVGSPRKVTPRARVSALTLVRSCTTS